MEKPTFIEEVVKEQGLKLGVFLIRRGDITEKNALNEDVSLRVAQYI
jgi:hypothetical protein